MIPRQQLEYLAVTSELQCGFFAKFFIINQFWGFKYFRYGVPVIGKIPNQEDIDRASYTMCHKAHSMQQFASKYGLAPKVGDVVEITVDKLSVSGYFTEIVPHMVEDGDLLKDDFVALKQKLYKIGFYTSDVHWKNVGFLRGNLVLFDFSSCDRRFGMEPLQCKYMIIGERDGKNVHVCSICQREIVTSREAVIGVCKGINHKRRMPNMSSVTVPGVRNNIRRPREIEYFDIGD